MPGYNFSFFKTYDMVLQNLRKVIIYGFRKWYILIRLQHFKPKYVKAFSRQYF
jgi:hypothetical protein